MRWDETGRDRLRQKRATRQAKMNENGQLFNMAYGLAKSERNLTQLTNHKKKNE